MPKRIAKRQTNRQAPYNLRASTATTTNMAAVATASPMWAHNPHTHGTAPHHQHHHHHSLHQHNLSWSDPSMTYTPYTHPHSYLPTTLPAPPLSAPVAHHQHQQHHHHQQNQHQQHQQHPGQSAPWTPQEDHVLIEAKSSGLGWNDIMKTHFPRKSGNACRKRHERLMQKLRTTNWDDARVARVVTEYHSPRSGARERFWRELATRVGEERWEDVERVCFQQGLKNLRTASASSHSRGRSRASSGGGTGIGIGIGTATGIGGARDGGTGQLIDDYDHDREHELDHEHDQASSQGGGDYGDAAAGTHDDSGYGDEHLGVGAAGEGPGPSRRSSGHGMGHHGHSLSLPMGSGGMKVDTLVGLGGYAASGEVHGVGMGHY